MKSELYIQVNSETYLKQVNEGTIILEPRNVFDAGVVGYEEKTSRLVYSCAKLLPSLMSVWEMTEEEALEWLSYNTLGTYVEGYPIIIEDLFEEDGE